MVSKLLVVVFKTVDRSLELFSLLLPSGNLGLQGRLSLFQFADLLLQSVQFLIRLDLSFLELLDQFLVVFFELVDNFVKRVVGIFSLV